MNRNKTSRQHNFAVIPSVDVPRSAFNLRQTRKMAFDASDLIPIMCEEVLPGDTWRHREGIAARLATPIAPVVDDLDIETFYFWIPNRIQANFTPGGNIEGSTNQWENLITGQEDETIPTLSPPADGGGTRTIPVGSVLDHFGLPAGAYADVVGPPAIQLEFNALPIWGYFRIYNEWFRDQNLIEPWFWTSQFGTNYETDEIGQGEDTQWDMMPLRVCKRHDYFTSSLPFAQKGPAVTLSLGTTAPIFTAAAPVTTGTQAAMQLRRASTGVPVTATSTLGVVDPGSGTTEMWFDAAGGFVSGDGGVYPSNLVADLTAATAQTINEIRLAAVTQQLLERDARGGSRYVENLLAHWGVRSPDYRMNRPEYLGGSKIPVTVNPIAQTAAYDAEPANAASAVGNLGAEMHANNVARTFNFAATEHGYIIGVACVRATPTYQQGFRRHWIARRTRLDFWDPLFSSLGEQAVLTQEIYMPPTIVASNNTWGYQEQGAEYRYTPNEITGVLRSTAPQPLDWWHYAEEFMDEPALNAEFILDKTKETLARSLATAPSAQWSAQMIIDIVHDSQVARMMPAYSVPGIDRF